MNASVDDIIRAYLRELSTNRKWYALCFLAVAVGSLLMAFSWPKSYTSSSTIYADNSNILKPLMEGNAISTSIVDQARMAKEILFKREFTDEVLKAGGWDPASLSPTIKESLIQDIQGRTDVTNIGRSPASLISIAHRDSDPIRAFSIAQKYTALFIEESVVARRAESRSAFQFIQSQVDAYQAKLSASEEALSKFKSENNNGTLNDANSRISRYRAEIERLELELVQLATEEKSVQAGLSGESEVAKSMTEMVALRNRINSLQLTLDNLKSRFRDNYPDVIQVQQQIDDLMYMYEQGNTGTIIPQELENGGMTPLHQELRSRLAQIKTSIQSKNSQLSGIRTLLDLEMERVKLINESEAQLAELNRDYNVTQAFYNDMLKRLENARVSVNLNEEQQGVTFKVQESAIIPTRPDGLSFSQMLLGSLILAIGAPLGLLVVYMELDPRVRSESTFKPEWPPLLIAVPPMKALVRWRVSNKVFASLLILMAIGIYGGVAAINAAGFI